MDFESGFADVERTASVAMKSAATLVTAIKQLQKAVEGGELAAMHKATERVGVISKSLSQDLDNAVAAWPFSIESEERYMREAYAGEFLERARSEGLQILRVDDGYLLYPSIVRINSIERSVIIDRTKVKTVRPSSLVRRLKLLQSAKSKTSPEQFLELLHRTYRILTEKQYGRTISLSAVYETLTLMPGSAATYGQTEFARDLFLLDRSGETKTKSGAIVSLPASTGTKGAKGTFSFMSSEGETVTYYGIHFLEASA
jgi:hypothetical protein